ncbi:MAG: helix-turn-helix domain-containing protein [Pseudomonadota bacterium]
MQTAQNPSTLELMREGARQALDADRTWEEPLHEAVEALFDITTDPTAREAIRRYNSLSTTHFARSVLQNPQTPVDAFIDPNIRFQIRDQLRNGTPEIVLNAYRAAQIVAWRAWMRLSFTLTDDKQELEQLLEFSAQQINDYSERSLRLLSDLVDQVRAEFVSRSTDTRFQTVQSILRRELRELKPASSQLRYPLERSHQAIVIWSRSPDTDARALEAAADAVEEVSGSGAKLRVDAKSSTTWLWSTTQLEPTTRFDDLDSGVQLAIGPRRAGIEGFVESHERAVVAQRIVLKAQRNDRIVRFEEIELAHLLLEQPQCYEFARSALGRLFDASVSTQDSLRIYLEEGSNAAVTASRLGIHRNTLNQRLERAKDLLPERALNPKNRASVAAALHVLHWS